MKTLKFILLIVFDIEFVIVGAIVIRLMISNFFDDD
jgi:hypothetical protein